MDCHSTQEVEVELIFALHAAFLRYGPINKIAIFRYETWNLEKVQKLHMDAFLPLRGRT